MISIQFNITCHKNFGFSVRHLKALRGQYVSNVKKVRDNLTYLIEPENILITKRSFTLQNASRDFGGWPHKSVFRIPM